MDYVYNRYARVYYNQIIDIYNKNNPATMKEKDEQLENIVTNLRYKEELNELQKKVTDRKMKIAIKYFFLKGKNMAKIFVKLNKLRKHKQTERIVKLSVLRFTLSEVRKEQNLI